MLATEPVTTTISPDAPLMHLRFQRSVTGVTIQTVLEKPVLQKQRRKSQHLLENDWFRQGAPVAVNRKWQEVFASGAFRITETPDARRLVTYDEHVKGRILGLSQSGKVWVLVYLYKRKRVPAGAENSIEHWWELRLVAPDDIEPLSAGVSVPPGLPSVWERQLPRMPFDKQRIIG